VQKQEVSSRVLEALEGLQKENAIAKWGKALDGTFTRRSVMIGELRNVGVKQPDQIAKPSVRNDTAFLGSVLGGSSIVAVLALQLPGAPCVRG
jgi:succinylarginine dihydrolase